MKVKAKINIVTEHGNRIEKNTEWFVERFEDRYQFLIITRDVSDMVQESHKISLNCFNSFFREIILG